MDVKILPWEKGTDSYALNDNLILLVHKVSKKASDSTVMLPFRRVDYSVYNIKTRVMEKILPDFSKFRAAKFYYASNKDSLIYFIHIEYPKFPMATFMVFCYDYEAHTCTEVFRFDDNLKSYENGKALSLFILNEQYLLFQFRNETNNAGKNEYQSFVYDCKNRISYNIEDERFTKQGIMQFIPVAPNVCAVRFGHNQLEHGRLIPMDRKDCAREAICLISISQFIADVLLKIKIISSEIIDEEYIDKTFSEIKKLGKFIVYSRIDRATGFQEIFFYQYITKEASMLLNNNIYDPSDIFPCVMNGKPIVVRRLKKYYEFYQIKGNKILFRLPADEKIVFCDQDYVVVNSRRKKLFGKAEDRTVITQFSSQKNIYKETVKPVSFMLVGKDTLVIFVEERND